ncbi:MAG: hypothetical protein AB7I19_16835 [Planctomycetota bacterium]
MNRSLPNLWVVATIVAGLLALGWALSGSLAARVTPMPDAPSLAGAAESADDARESAVPMVVDGLDTSEVMERLRKPARVALVAEEPQIPGAADLTEYKSFRTLGPLDAQGADFFLNTVEAEYMGEQARLADLSARAVGGEAPDIARYAVLNHAAALDRACLDAFRRGDYVTIADDDDVASDYFSRGKFADCLTRFRNGRLQGRLVRLVFVLCKDRYPEYHQAVEHEAEAGYFLSQEFSKKFNALPEPRRRELWAARNDSRSPLHNEAVEYFKCRVPHRLSFDEALGMVSASPPRAPR